jgi:hypothetical protein
MLDPLPPVPARIEPLGPAPARAIPADPTWEGFVQSFCPVRELSPGERPRDWVGNANDAGTSSVEASETGTIDADDAPTTTDLVAPAPVKSKAPASAKHAGPESLAPERYKVQFTATAEYVRLVEEAKALLSHAAPRATLDEIHLRALRAFVTMLRKQKYATAEAPSYRLPSDAAAELPGRQGKEPRVELEPAAEGKSRPPRQRGRHVPASVRRAVFKRDGQQCSYFDPAGRRCIETHRLEFHHLEPFARGGEHTPANLALRCAAHNALAAEEDFGREIIEVAKAGQRTGQESHRRR